MVSWNTQVEDNTKNITKHSMINLQPENKKRGVFLVKLSEREISFLSVVQSS